MGRFSKILSGIAISIGGSAMVGAALILRPDWAIWLFIGGGALVLLGLVLAGIGFLEEKPSIDNRKGFFNWASNYGTQNYNEAPAQRVAPPNLGAALGVVPSNVTVQVRVYGMDHEMKSFGDSLVSVIGSSGLQVLDFGDDNGTQIIRGVLVVSAPNDISRQIAKRIVATLQDSGIKATIGTENIAWVDQQFVRIGVGANPASDPIPS